MYRSMHSTMADGPHPKKARMLPGPVKCTISKSGPLPSSPARTAVHMAMYSLPPVSPHYGAVLALVKRWAQITNGAGAEGRRLLCSGSAGVLEPSNQFVVRGGPDDPVELGPIARDQADVLDQDIIDEPTIRPLHQMRLDGYLRPVLGDNQRPHDRVVAVDLLTHVLDLIAAVFADPGQVPPLQEIPEQLHKLRSLRRRALLPVEPEGSLGGFRHVERLAGDRSYRLQARRGRQPRVLQGLHDLIGVRAQLIGRRTRPRVPPKTQRHDDRHHPPLHDPRAPSEALRRCLARDCRPGDPPRLLDLGLVRAIVSVSTRGTTR